MSNLLTNVKKSKWIRHGSNSAEQNNLYVNYPFEELKAVLIECIKYQIPIPWSYLRNTKNLDFGDSIELNAILFRNFNIHYVNHSLYKEITYRIYYLKQDVACNLICQLEPFNYSSLQKTKTTVVTTLEELQSEFLNFKIGTLTGTSWGTYRQEVYQIFRVKIDIYEELLRKIDFYLTYNHQNPDNPNKKDWPQYISVDPHSASIEKISSRKIKSLSNDFSSSEKIRTNRTFSELKGIFEIIFDFEKLKLFLPDPELFHSKSIYIDTKYLNHFIYRIFDLGNSDYDEEPDLSYTGFSIQHGFLCVWASFLRDLIEEEGNPDGMLNHYLAIISNERNQGKNKKSLAAFKKHFIGDKGRNDLEKSNKRILVKKLTESIK